MDNSTIYSRTNKGTSEVINRSKTIDSICRNVLIQVNGKVTINELIKNTPTKWSTREKLVELESNGMIRNVKSAKSIVRSESIDQSTVDKKNPGKK